MIIINSTILSGAGAIPSLTPLLPDIRKVLLVTGRNIAQLGDMQQIRTSLEKHCSQANVIDNVPAESTHHNVRQLMGVLDDAPFDVVVGIGGGSVLDVVELLSVLCHPQSPGLDALLAGGKPTQRVQSWLTPTTVGVGSEATSNTILAIPEQSAKVGIISQALLPDYMALFPEPTINIPTHIAASTGIDALCHLLERFTATVANPVSDNAALTRLSKLFRHTQPAVNDPQDLCVKLEILWTSYYGGVAITHADAYPAHALSYPLGGRYHLPHGVASAVLLMPCMAFVRPWVIEEFVRVWDCTPDTETVLSTEERSHVLVAWLQALINQLELPSDLADLGAPPGGIAFSSEAALNVKRLANDVPCQLDLQDIQAIYQTLSPQRQFKEQIMLKAIEGVLTAVVTPSTTTNSLNVPALKVQVNRQLGTGNAISCGSTNGEFFMLNEQEKLSATQTCVGEVVGRAPVMAYIDEISIYETIRLGQQIEKLGVGAVSVIAPYSVPLKQEELIAHYNAITDALSIPMFLCNIPACTGSTIQPGIARALAPHPNIIRIKDSAGSDESLKGFLNAVRDVDGFNVPNDPDSLIHKGFVEGCSVCISGFTSIASRGINAIQSRFHVGDIEESYEVQESVTGLRTDLYKVALPPTAVKKALQLIGHDIGDSCHAVNLMSEQINETQQIVRHYNTN